MPQKGTQKARKIVPGLLALISSIFFLHLVIFYLICLALMPDD